MSNTTQANAPDVRQLSPNTLPELAFPGGRHADFRIFFQPEVYERVWKHAAENVAVEICGVLVGKWARDADGPFALISEAIRGEAAASKFAEVTFTHETWNKINQEMDTKFAELSIVGWYHSHPNFGVFLSDRDRFIQEHFFSGPGQLAYVVDPVRKTEGVFVWRAGKPALAPHYWVGDRVQVATEAGAESPGPAPSGTAAAASGQPTSPAAARAELDWLTLIGVIAVAVLVFLGGYLVAGKINDAERRRIEQVTEERALGRWTFLNIRPGLYTQLDQLGVDLEQALRGTKDLALQHVKAAENRREAEIQWKDKVFRPLVRSFGRVQDIQATYSLPPKEERKVLKQLTQGQPKKKKPKPKKPKVRKKSKPKED
jgi:proteasome lid subunit RPN8/RPN11